MEDFIEMFDKLNEDEKGLFVKNKYGYIFAKAKLFLEIGAKEYLEIDFIKIDTSDLNNEDFEILYKGCRQILNGKGLSVDRPFENIGILGFAKLFEIFHFNAVRIKTLKPESMRFLDVMCLEHIVDGYHAEYFNLIEY